MNSPFVNDGYYKVLPIVLVLPSYGDIGHGIRHVGLKVPKITFKKLYSNVSFQKFSFHVIPDNPQHLPTVLLCRMKCAYTNREEAWYVSIQ